MGSTLLILELVMLVELDVLSVLLPLLAQLVIPDINLMILVSVKLVPPDVPPVPETVWDYVPSVPTQITCLLLEEMVVYVIQEVLLMEFVLTMVLVLMILVVP